MEVDEEQEGGGAVTPAGDPYNASLLESIVTDVLTAEKLPPQIEAKLKLLHNTYAKNVRTLLKARERHERDTRQHEGLAKGEYPSGTRAFRLKVQPGELDWKLPVGKSWSFELAADLPFREAKELIYKKQYEINKWLDMKLSESQVELHEDSTDFHNFIKESTAPVDAQISRVSALGI